MNNSGPDTFTIRGTYDNELGRGGTIPKSSPINLNNKSRCATSPGNSCLDRRGSFFRQMSFPSGTHLKRILKYMMYLYDRLLEIETSKFLMAIFVTFQEALDYLPLWIVPSWQWVRCAILQCKACHLSLL